jgi:hypothetical protein
VLTFSRFTPTESVQLYASHLTDLGSPEGMTFRLKHPQGQILYTFILYKGTAFDEVNSTISRNEDGTRFFIFIPEETLPYSTLKVGMYQCAFTYQRDIGSAHPVLRRFGSSADEEAIIRFALPIAPA